MREKYKWMKAVRLSVACALQNDLKLKQMLFYVLQVC